MMKLWYRANGNFGDELNPWLWRRLLPDMVHSRDEATLLVGIGTLLDDRVPAAPSKVILGTGAGYNRLPELDRRWHFLSVRGPSTAAALGLPGDLAVTDSAMLVSSVLKRRPPRRGAAFMPHHESADQFDWPRLCRRLGITYLDPFAPVTRTLGRIARSRLVIAEAMHAAIVADALRVPWVPVAIYPQINSFKWNDWCASVELEYEPVRLKPLRDNSSQEPLRRLRGYVRRVRRTRKLTRNGRRPDLEPSPPHEVGHLADQLAGVRDRTDRGRLSIDSVLRDRLSRLQEQLSSLRAGQFGFTPQ